MCSDPEQGTTKDQGDLPYLGHRASQSLALQTGAMIQLQVVLVISQGRSVLKKGPDFPTPD